MRNKFLAVLAALAVAVVLGATSARADSFDFSTIGPTNSDVGHSGTVQNASATLTITIAAFNYPSYSDADIYNKASGPGETGLGVANDPLYANEISNADYLSFDMTDLTSSNITSGLFTIESVQTGESFMICTSDAANLLDENGGCSTTYVGTNADNGTIQVFVNWNTNTNDNFVNIIGVSHDVLVASNFTTDVPEPGTLTLLGTGLLGMAGFLRRKLRA